MLSGAPNLSLLYIKIRASLLKSSWAAAAAVRGKKTQEFLVEKNENCFISVFGEWRMLVMCVLVQKGEKK